MKKLLLLLLILILIMNAKSQDMLTIVVRTPEEFIEAIGSDRVIQLEGSLFKLSEVSHSKSGVYYNFFEEFDGYELVITGVKNLKLVGIGQAPVKIVTEPQYGDVLCFQYSNGITLENIEAGHEPDKGYCTGGVFNFSNCSNIQLDHCILFGSGIEGITAELVTNLTCRNTIIKGCSYSIMTLTNCKNFEFSNCVFTDNREFDLFTINNCSKIRFILCDINNNMTCIDSYCDYALFSVNESSFVSLDRCSIENNICNYISNHQDSPQFIHPIMSKNEFTKGEYKK